MNTKRKGPAAATDLEELELPTSRVCAGCGKKFYGSGTDRCLQCRLAAETGPLGGKAGGGGESENTTPRISVRTYP